MCERSSLILSVYWLFFSPGAYEELLPRPSASGVISMKEGIQIYYNDQLGGRSPEGSDSLGNFWVKDSNRKL